MKDRVTNIGEQYNVSGRHNVGKIETNYGSERVDASLQDLIASVQALRNHLPAAERRVIDQSVETVKHGEHVEPGRLRTALTTIAGIAAVVGEVGAPVLQAVRKVVTALGM